MIPISMAIGLHGITVVGGYKLERAQPHTHVRAIYSFGCTIIIINRKFKFQLPAAFVTMKTVKIVVSLFALADCHCESCGI